MQIKLDGLDAALARGLPGLAWVHGDEPLLVIEAADTIRAALRAAGFVEREVLAVDRSFRVDALLAQAGTMSLFATSRLIELRLSGKPGKDLGDALAALAASIDDSTRILVSGPRLDRTTTDSAWFGQLERNALSVAIYPVERARLGQWIAARLARQGQRLDAATLAFVADRVEGNLLAAHQEVLKLGLLFGSGQLAGEEVRQAVLDVARYDAFGVGEAMLAGDAARTLRTLDGLAAEGQAAPFVLWAMTDAIRNLWRLSHARDRGENPAQLTRALRIYPPRDRAFLDAVRRLDTTTIEAAVRFAAQVDRMAKGVAPGDPWAAMAHLGMKIAGAPAYCEP